MTTISDDFWIGRLNYALDKAAAAPSERARAAYLELARHYCSMHELSDRPKRRPVAPRHDPVPSRPAESGRLDFRSVHDALMQAA